MANIPPVNRTPIAYSRLKKKGSLYVSKTEESTEQVHSKQDSTDRRRTRDRRRANKQVLFDRRKLNDRRFKSIHRISEKGSGNSHSRKGRKINTTA